MSAAAIGAGLMLAAVVYLSIRYARAVARFLLSLAAAREAFRETWCTENPNTRRTAKSSTNAAGPVAVPSAALDLIQAETIEALAGLGMNRKTATARVRSEGTAADVQTLLRRCMVKAA